MSHHENCQQARPLMMLTALGVVFGAIGTSPLYAMRTILGEGDDLSTTTVYAMASPNGQPLRVSTFRTAPSAGGRSIGQPDLHPHQLRHTAASWLSPAAPT
jgi:integrase